MSKVAMRKGSKMETDETLTIDQLATMIRKYGNRNAEASYQHARATELMRSATEALAEHVEYAADSYADDEVDDLPLDDYAMEAADQTANLVYTSTIREVFDALGGLALIEEVEQEYGRGTVSRALTEGSGQYPAGSDALGVLCIYHAVSLFLGNLVDEVI